MAAPAVEVVNGREFRKAIRDCEESCNDLKDAHQRAGQIVVVAATGAAPRRTGRLAGKHKASRAKARARVTVNTVYANPVHWGWPRHGISPNPWLYEAAIRTEPVWLPVYEADVNKIIDKFDRAAS